jgi:hypothetical protein
MSMPSGSVRRSLSSKEMLSGELSGAARVVVELSLLVD